MKISIKFWLLLLTLIVSGTAPAQRSIRRAKEAATQHRYNNAIALYRYYKKAEQNIHVCRALGELYTKLRVFDSAAYWEQKVLLFPSQTYEDRIALIKSLMAIGDYDSAKRQLDSLNVGDTTFGDVQRLRISCDSAAYWSNHPVKGILENMEAVNSIASDWGYSIHNGVSSFCSGRDYIDVGQKHAGGVIMEPVFQIYRSDTTGIHSLSLPYATNATHLASASFYNEDKDVYYASAGIQKTKQKPKGSSFTYHVAIKHAQYLRGHWMQGDDFPFNSLFEFSVADPFVVPSGDTIYFVSDKGEDNIGGTDIYFCVKDVKGDWNKPINLGDEINTAGNERTPFVIEGNLYFASDGRVGPGALDLYQASTDSFGHWQVTLLPAPINSSYDDFSPFVLKDSLYFSSNRPGGKGSDDMYRFVYAHDTRASAVAKDSSGGNSATVSPKQEPDPSSIHLNAIFFDFDKAVIKSSSTHVLDSLVILLNEHPDWKLDIAAHTDIRGSNKYNDKLSGQRAKAAIDYLVKKGIAADRLHGKGYGKRMPLLECGSLIKCRERIHWVNRRVEFTISR